MKRLCLSNMLIALLAGCASFTPKPLDPTAQQTAFESRRLDGPEMRQSFERNLGQEIAPWPPLSWDLATSPWRRSTSIPILEPPKPRSYSRKRASHRSAAGQIRRLGVSLQNNTDMPAGQSP